MNLKLPRFITIKNPFELNGFKLRDLAGARTQDPLLKREMLYQLSYQIIKLYIRRFANAGANI